MKYIMLEIPYTGGIRQKIPIIFPDQLVHEDVAEHMKLMIFRSMAKIAGPVSAGFIDLGSEIACHGDSETLRLHSLEDLDAGVIRTYDYLHGLSQ